MYHKLPTLNETIKIVAPQVGHGELPVCDSLDEVPSKSPDVDRAAIPAPQRYKASLKSVGKHLGVASVSLAAFFNYILIYFLAGDFYWRITGMDPSNYVFADSGAARCGLMIALAGTVGFMCAFIARKGSVVASIIGGATGLGLLFCIAMANGRSDAPLDAFIALLAFAIMCGLARCMRLAIPSTFRAERAVIQIGLASIPAAIFVASALSMIVYEAVIVQARHGFAGMHSVTNQSHSYSSPPLMYSASTSGYWIGCLLVLSLTLLIPTMVMAINARTSEFKPIFALNILQLSPLILGFVVQASMLAIEANGAVMLLASIGSLLVLLSMIAGGSALGAFSNRLEHRKAMKKAANSLIV